MNDNIMKMFLEKLKKESNDSPMVKINASANECLRIIRQASTNEKKEVIIDRFIYIAAALAGVSCVKAALEYDIELKINENNKKEYMSIYKVDTEAGTFLYGDAINKFLITDEYSVWNLAAGVYKKNKLKKKIPDITELVKNNIANCSKKDYKLWNSSREPYREIEDVKATFKNILKYLDNFELKQEQIPVVFAVVLQNAIEEVEKVLPKNVNCLEMAMETVIYFAHINYL